MIFIGGHKSQRSCLRINRMNKNTVMKYCFFKSVSENSDLSAWQAASVTCFHINSRQAGLMKLDTFQTTCHYERRIKNWIHTFVVNIIIPKYILISRAKIPKKSVLNPSRFNALFFTAEMFKAEM